MEKTLCIRPPVVWKVPLSLLLFAMTVLFTTQLVFDWQNLNARQSILYVFMTGFFIVGGIDYWQRIYEFNERNIRVRFFFFWKIYPLPSQIKIKVSALKQTLIVDSESNRIILLIPKDYFSQGKLPEQLGKFYSCLGREQLIND